MSEKKQLLWYVSGVNGEHEAREDAAHNIARGGPMQLSQHGLGDL